MDAIDFEKLFKVDGIVALITGGGSGQISLDFTNQNIVRVILTKSY
jgi:hypothetical protein